VKKKKIIVCVAIVIVAFSLVYSLLAINGIVPTINPRELFKSDNNELTGVEKIKEIIETTRPTDIAILGDDISFSIEIETRKVDKIDESTIQRKEGFKYTVLVINDLNNNVSLTEEEQDLLRKKVKEYGFSLIYLGEKYSDTWNSEDEIPLDLKGNLFYIHYSVSGTQCGAIGAWTTEDQNLLKTYPYSLGETILYSIESFLKEIG